MWRVLPGDWYKDSLISFTFDGKDQDIKKFCDDPYWRARLGDNIKSRFKWAGFYEKMADKLLEFKHRRKELIEGIHKIGQDAYRMLALNDQHETGVPGGPLEDICPFTVMALFNRGLTIENRKKNSGRVCQAPRYVRI